MTVPAPSETNAFFGVSYEKGLKLVEAFIIAAAVLWIYRPALHGDWLWDDGLLVTDNALVQAPDGWWRIWFAPGHLLDYQPIKVSVVWLQWHLWGMHTVGYHLTNIVLHIISAFLVWRLLGKFGLRRAWLGGLLFAIHPVQVESVAWIAELKNTLSLPPFLLAMCAYLDFDEKRRPRDYALALGLFLVAMLCKTTMVMFPVVILLYTWWKRGSITRNDLKAAAPFFAVSLGLGIVSLWFLNYHAVGEVPVHLGGFFSRLACAGLSLSFYLSLCLWPVGLIPIYPQWPVDPPSLIQFLPWPVLGGMVWLAWKKRASWGRHALLGFGFFLVNLAPFVGFNAASYMMYTWVMDHLLYIPIIGLIGLAVAGAGQVEERLSPALRAGGMAIVAVIFTLLAVGSHDYAAIFINQKALWTYTQERNPDAYTAANNLGYLLQQSGQSREAIEQFERALRIRPDYADAHNNLGVALEDVGRLPEAIAQFERAVAIRPHYRVARVNLANALVKAGRIPEAIEQYQIAWQIRPGTSGDEDYLGTLFLQTGQVPEALDAFRSAVKMEPTNADAQNHLGMALAASGRQAEAIACFEESLKIRPGDARTNFNLGQALQQTGNLSAALHCYQESLKIDPNYADAHNNLGILFIQTGHKTEAAAEFKFVLQINPHDATASYNLAQLQGARKTAPARK